MHFTETEKAILRVVQQDLPDSLTPFADIARAAGVDEAFVLDLLRRLKRSGAIRRFGASIKHQKAGFSHNAMVAWRVDASRMEDAGEQAALHPMVSHCYYRPSDAADWPYELYTMIHGKSQEDCEKSIAELARIPGMDEPAVLTSLKEMKKVSMSYF